MKRTWILLLAASLTFSLAACGDEGGGQVTPTVDAGNTEEDTGTPDPDLGMDAGQEVDLGADMGAEDMGTDMGQDEGLDLTGTWELKRTEDDFLIASFMVTHDPLDNFFVGTYVMGDAMGGIDDGIVNLPTDGDVSMVALQKPEHDLEQCGLAGAVVPEHGNPFTCVQRKRHVIDGLVPGKGLADAVHAEGRCRKGRFGHP